MKKLVLVGIVLAAVYFGGVETVTVPGPRYLVTATVTGGRSPAIGALPPVL